MKFTEKQLHDFAAPLSDTEDQQCINAIKMVRDALAPMGFSAEGRTITPLYEGTSAYSLRMMNPSTNRDIKIFVQGSYANNTNVRTESDVDIAIVQEETFTIKLRPGVNQSAYRIVDAPPSSKSFKDEVQSYLQNKFGTDVERKNKSIKVRGNNYRKDADTVPCGRFKDYSSDFKNDINNFIGGIKIITDDGDIIINYPEQHIANGKKKNDSTNHYYKKMVRIAKKMRYLMVDAGFTSATHVHSFGIESILWNVPDSVYLQYINYRYIFDEVLKYLVNNINTYNTFREANGIKLLCPTVSELSAYQSFIRDLATYFDYDI